MHLNLKDDETVALVTEVAQRLGLTKTGAVRQLAREKLVQLEGSEQSDRDARLRHALEWLERDVWPHSAAMRNLSKKEEEELLGYDEMYS
jgi:hypothetical protein